MTIPDYIISYTISEEHRQRQRSNAQNTDVKVRFRKKMPNATFAFTRRQMSGALRVAADRIEPQPECRCGSHRDTRNLQVLK